MKLLIDISEEDREDISNIHFIREDLKFKIGKAIMNGTPFDSVKAEIQDLYVGYRDGYEIMADVLHILNCIGKESEDVVVANKNLCDSCTTKNCIFQSGIVRNHCDFYKAESEEQVIKHNPTANRIVKADSIEVWKAEIREREHTKELLDRIRTEIDQLPLVLLAGNYHIDKDSVMQILDKYRAESEDT